MQSGNLTSLRLRKTEYLENINHRISNAHTKHNEREREERETGSTELYTNSMHQILKTITQLFYV